ncbi:hypothetical protein MVEN_00661400 [Mycena venus]|uniref:DUF6533 domain-containing protein n=1 Tax=Mycena venus TaxID=2733690 RepID=A0A8H6YQR9_9AGAR|nr:hypothetical protein MVEN_00661400 [Mycena venus]
MCIHADLIHKAAEPPRHRYVGIIPRWFPRVEVCRCAEASIVDLPAARSQFHRMKIKCLGKKVLMGKKAKRRIDSGIPVGTSIHVGPIHHSCRVPLSLMDTVTVIVEGATIAYDHRINRYFYLAGIALLVYDNLLTLDPEIRYIWKAWRTRTSAWYLFIRYSSLCIRTMALLTFDFGHFDPET